MWLNKEHLSDNAINAYRQALRHGWPNHVVIDNLFISAKLDQVCSVLQQDSGWQTQKHTYSALYVDDVKWQKTRKAQRFVQRDVWQRTSPEGNSATATSTTTNAAWQFLSFLRSDEFMALLSRIFKVQLTDIHVAKPELNTNYFRLGDTDFVNQHADDSPGREVCMLLYLNTNWHSNAGGELVFTGKDDKPVTIAPLYNRCVLFNPSSSGSEHWVKPVATGSTLQYRYNVTSWYWSE